MTFSWEKNNIGGLIGGHVFLQGHAGLQEGHPAVGFFGTENSFEMKKKHMKKTMVFGLSGFRICRIFVGSEIPICLDLDHFFGSNNWDMKDNFLDKKAMPQKFTKVPVARLQLMKSALPRAAGNKDMLTKQKVASNV